MTQPITNLRNLLAVAAMPISAVIRGGKRQFSRQQEST